MFILVLNISDEYKLKVISRKIDEGNEVKFTMSQKMKKNPIVLKIESITMEEYVPVIKGIAIIPEKFNVCSTINISAIINKSGKHIETNSERVRMK